MAIPQIASYPIPTERPDPQVSWALDATRAALLVHDMQHYFVRAYDPTQEPMSTALHNMRRLVAAAATLDIPVYYSAQPPSQAPARRGLLSELWGHGIQTEAEAAIIPELRPADPSLVVTKWRYSAFHRTDLREALAFSGRDQLLITGVYGHMGCKITAAEAFMHDIQPFLISDAIADFTARDHAETVSWVARRSGMVLLTDEAMGQLASGDKKEAGITAEGAAPAKGAPRATGAQTEGGDVHGA